jgi:hypothetical protein
MGRTWGLDWASMGFNFVFNFVLFVYLSLGVFNLG